MTKKSKNTKKSVKKTRSEEGKPLKEITEAVTKEKKASRKEVDIDKWVKENIREFIELSGLSILGLSEAQYIELLHDILTQLYGSPTTRTDVETVVRRYNRHKEIINELIANKLVQMFETPSPSLLDFIAANVRDSVLSVAPKIYWQIIKEKRTDLIEVLKIKWFNAWVSKRFRIPPITCPKCGFNSLMPDLSCLVCGSTISELQLKKHVDFEKSLEKFVNELPCSELRDLLNHDLVLLNSEGIKKPTDPRSPVDIEVYLTPKEKKIIRDAHTSRCRKVSNEDSE
ncbi:MAG: hypothetical protein ACP5KB_02775 [Thermoprotei archaeon]